MCVNTPTLFFCHFIYRPTHTSTTCNYIIQSRKYCLTKYGLRYEGILFKATRLYFEDRVYYVINNVIFELEQNPDRKFIEVEIAFFERWWRVQDDGLKARVKALVNSGQLQFA